MPLRPIPGIIRRHGIAAGSVTSRQCPPKSSGPPEGAWKALLDLGQGATRSWRDLPGRVRKPPVPIAAASGGGATPGAACHTMARRAERGTALEALAGRTANIAVPRERRRGRCPPYRADPQGDGLFTVREAYGEEGAGVSKAWKSSVQNAPPRRVRAAMVRPRMVSTSTRMSGRQGAMTSSADHRARHRLCMKGSGRRADRKGWRAAPRPRWARSPSRQGAGEIGAGRPRANRASVGSARRARWLLHCHVCPLQEGGQRGLR